jgi:hypothetical protein
MSALGTHEITAAMGAGLEPPLSPPVVRGPEASALPVGDGLSGLPTPPPAIRPPESAAAAPAPAASVPEAAPVHDYFAAEQVEEAGPVQEAPAAEAEVQSIPPAAPTPTPAEEPAELPTMAPPEPEVHLEPAPAVVATQPVALAPLAPVAKEPVVEEVVAPEPEAEEPFAEARTGFRVVVRLRDTENVDVGSFGDFGTAMAGAQEVIEQFSTATESQWPFYAGRFIRPDLIVSVDVVEDGEA